MRNACPRVLFQASGFTLVIQGFVLPLLLVSRAQHCPTMESRREDFAKGQEDVGVIEPVSDNRLISLHNGSFSCCVSKIT